MRKPINNIKFIVLCLNPVEYWTNVEKGCIYPVIDVESDGRYKLMNSYGKYVLCKPEHFLSLQRDN